MAEELMVEEKSKLSVLVIEDNAEFGANARKALNGHHVALSGTLEDARKLMEMVKFDMVLSDVHVPKKDGDGPESILSEMLEFCRTTGTPVCFVTRADHHGMLDLGDEGYVSLKATTQGRVLQTQMKLEDNPSEKEVFRKLETSESKTVRAAAKTPEIWSTALSMTMAAKAKPTSIGKAMRQVGKIGLGVVAEKGIPRVVPKK